MTHFHSGYVQWDARWLSCIVGHCKCNNSLCVWSTLEVHKVCNRVYYFCNSYFFLYHSLRMLFLWGVYTFHRCGIWSLTKPFALMFRPFGALTLLSTLMCEVIKALMMSNTEEETWSWVARDILLDTWTALLVVCILKCIIINIYYSLHVVSCYICVNEPNGPMAQCLHIMSMSLCQDYSSAHSLLLMILVSIVCLFGHDEIVGMSAFRLLGLAMKLKNV